MGSIAIDNVALTKKALWYLEKPASERKLKDYQQFFDRLAEDFVLLSRSPTGTGEISGKQAMIDSVIEFLRSRSSGLTEDVQLDGPMDFFGKDERVVMVGRESYTNKQTRTVTHRKEFALIADFRDSLIARILKFSD